MKPEEFHPLTSAISDRSFDALMAPRSCLCAAPLGEFHHGARRYALPHFVFTGPRGGGNDPIRLGLFAAIHGDEAGGAWARRGFSARACD